MEDLLSSAGWILIGPGLISLWLMVTGIIDVSHRTDLGRQRQSLWYCALVLVPGLATIMYWTFGRKGRERELLDRIHLTAEELERGKARLDSGEISRTEFEALKQQLSAAG